MTAKPHKCFIFFADFFRIANRACLKTSSTPSPERTWNLCFKPPYLKLVHQWFGFLEELGHDGVGQELPGLVEVERVLPHLGPVWLQLLVGEQGPNHILPQVHVREDLVRVPHDLLPFGEGHLGPLVRVGERLIILRHFKLHSSVVG